jgi:hypothetical protein
MGHHAVEAARRLRPLLAAHAQALREGRADDLRELNAKMQHALGVLSALAVGPLPPALADELRQLIVLSSGSQAWVARRQAGVEQSLEALAHGHAGLTQRQEMRTYGMRGGYGGQMPRGTGFGRA